MTPKAVVWKLEPHTKGKHEVLREYLKAWFAILGLTQGRILFIDGFAGPGEYADGEEGSPLIALKVLVEHRATLKAEVRFLFIEKDPKRAAHLEKLIEERYPSLPPKCSVDVLCSAFDETIMGVLDKLDAKGKFLAPAFVMADPFGVSGTPMSVLRRLLQGKKAELYVSFMYEAINRFKATPEFEKPLDGLFGTDAWRKGLSLKGDAKKDFFYGLYEKQLRDAGADHVIRFDLFEGNRLVYAIFFATHHWRGADRMKSAIWQVAPFGDFAFHGTRSTQLTLGHGKTDYTSLRAALQSEFRGKGWVTIEQVTRFVGSDKTDFHTSGLKTKVLKPMETDGLIEGHPKRKRARTYPEKSKLRFI